MMTSLYAKANGRVLNAKTLYQTTQLAREKRIWYIIRQEMIVVVNAQKKVIFLIYKN